MKTTLFSTLVMCTLSHFCLGQNTLELLSEPPKSNIVASYEGFDTGGNTSVVNESNMKFKFSGESVDEAGGFGYFNAQDEEIPYIKRNRDLGQTFYFTGLEVKTLKSITVKTGYGSSACREGIFGAVISLQLMEVTGTNEIHDNGSNGKMKAFHGYPHDRYTLDIPAHRDDYYSGEIYTHLKLWDGYEFPKRSDFGYSDQAEFDGNHKLFKGRFLRFEIPLDDSIQLKPQKTYAFVLMINQRGESQGFTLANNYEGNYEGGHGIRRSCNGTFPPLYCDPMKPLSHKINQAALQQAHLPLDMNERIHAQPGTNGYPDVDTFRDVVFFIEAE